MADDDATARGARGTARGGRAPASRPTTAAAAKNAPKKAAAGAQPAATRAPAKKVTTTRKAPVVKKAAPATAKKTPVVKKAAAAPPRRGGAVLGRATPTKKATVRKTPAARLAAEQTFDDDAWEAPAPAPEAARPDPHARVRGILRAAAQSLAAQERAAAGGASARAPVATPVPEPEPLAEPEPAAEPEPTTRVLIGPQGAAAARPAVEPEVEPEVDDEVEEAEPEAELEPGVDDEDQGEDEGDWAPPDVIEEPAEEEPVAAPAATAVMTRPASPPPESSTPPEPPPPLWRPAAQSGATIAAPERAPTGTAPGASPAPSEPKPERRAGAGIPVLAIVLALVVPLIGAVVGFVLATRARRRNAPLAGVARVVAVLAFVAWLVGGGAAAVARSNGGEDYSKLKVGDCFNSSATNQVRGVKVIPCSKSHNSEVFFLVTHPAAKGAAYPGKDQLVQYAADACLGQPLTDYLGIPLEQSKLKDFEIVPQSSAWKDGRRVLVCGLDTGGQGRITGSVKGSRR